MSKKSILLFVFLLFLGVSIFIGIKLISFSSDRVWTNLPTNKIPFPVFDTIVKQFSKEIRDNVTLLDSTYNGKVTVVINNNHFLLFSFDYCTIYYKNRSVTIKKEEYSPPYVIYQNKMFYSVTRKGVHDSSSLQMKFIDLN